MFRRIESLLPQLKAKTKNKPPGAFVQVSYWMLSSEDDCDLMPINAIKRIRCFDFKNNIWV